MISVSIYMFFMKEESYFLNKINFLSCEIRSLRSCSFFSFFLLSSSSRCFSFWRFLSFIHSNSFCFAFSLSFSFSRSFSLSLSSSSLTTGLTSESLSDIIFLGFFFSSFSFRSSLSLLCFFS